MDGCRLGRLLSALCAFNKPLAIFAKATSYMFDMAAIAPIYKLLYNQI